MNVKKHLRVLAFVFLSMIYVCGCSSKGNKDEKIDVSTITVAPTDTTVMPTSTTATAIDVEPTIDELNGLVKLSIYTIDGKSAEKVALTVMVPNDIEITPKLIVDKVVESMADETFIIGIDSVNIEGDAIIVSFLEDQPPVKTVGSSVEGEILDAIAQSLLDNLEGKYQKVIYRVMGEAYSSGHFQFDINEVYME